MFLDEMEDEDVLEEAETIKFGFETLIQKTPLIVKEVSKVKLNSPLLLFVCLIWDRDLLCGLHRSHDPTTSASGIL